MPTFPIGRPVLPTLSPWATASDLEALLRRSLTPEEVAATELLIAGLVGLVKGIARQQIEHVEDDTIQLVGGWSSVMGLPQRPVTAVSAVALRDPAGINISLIETRDYVWNRQGRLQRIGFITRIPRPIEGYWGGPASTVTVTYSHGFQEVPEELRFIVRSAALRRFVNPEGTAEVHIGNYSEKLSAEVSSSELTPEEIKTIKRFRPGPVA